MTSDLASRIDRYANRELHPAAARALAHEALDDSDLFEELTAFALARAAMDSPATSDRALAQSALDDEELFETLVARGAIETSLEDPAFHVILRTGHRRKHSAIAIVGVAAAAAVAAGLLAFFFLRPSAQPILQPPQQAQAPVSKPAAVTPTVLLTSDLQPARRRGGPIFRGAELASRAPKTEGAIVSLVDGEATLNLGSIDGLAKGTELPVIRDRQIGRIEIATVFRDRARGNVIDGKTIRSGDQVQVPSLAHLNGIVQEVDSLAASGYLEAARDLAKKSIVGGAPGETRQLLERLGALDYRSGAVDAARESYEVAANNFDQPPAASPSERAATLASFAALSLLRGDQQRASDLLQKALAITVEPNRRFGLLNNLGAAAELSGDRAKAADYYNQALAQKTSRRNRAIVRANLARVKNPTHP
jgi:hypothetical protein